MRLENLKIVLNEPEKTDTFYETGVGVMSASMTIDGKKHEILSAVNMCDIENSYLDLLKLVEASIKRSLN